MCVVPLGINMAGYEARPASQGTDDFCVGYFARLAPEKGLHVLADAYVRFRRQIGPRRARLEAAGYLARAHEPYLKQVRRTLEKAGLAGEFSYRGALDRDGKLRFLRTLDVLSVPATYDEPKGMFLLEAMASGVPVVQPRRGAFVEIVERTGGGLLVNPDDPDSLAEGLHTLWQDRATARSLSQRAFHGVRAQYSVAKSADALLDVYEALLNRSATSHADSAASVA
jgi:glycosyltransferase involved in cell wall biosynthesis